MRLKGDTMPPSPRDIVI